MMSLNDSEWKKLMSLSPYCTRMEGLRDTQEDHIMAYDKKDSEHKSKIKSSLR